MLLLLNFIWHLQGLPNHILAYHCLIFLEINMEFKLQDSETKRHFRPLFDSMDYNKNSKILLHIYKTYSIIC